MKFLTLSLFTILTVLGLQSLASAQTQDFKLHQFYPSDFNQWTAVATNSVAAASATAVLSSPTVNQITARGGNRFNPFVVNSTVLINAGGADVETVTITAVTSGATNNFTATFGTAHTGRFNVQSGTYGLQEAIDAAVASGSGGVVFVEPTYPGTTAMLLAAIRGTASIPLIDRRSGHNDYYLWSGSAYYLALADTPGANGSSLNILTKTTTIAGAAAATISATNFIPAGSIVLGLTSYVTSTFSNTSLTSMKIGDGTTAAQFSSATMALVAGTTSNSIDDGAATAVPFYGAATSVVVTGNGASFTTNGIIRIVMWYITLTPPTS